MIAGKELPACADFAEGLALAGHSVVVAGGMDAEKTVSASGVSVAPWNKSSSIAARSLIIQAETAAGFIDDAILYFDAPLFASQYLSFSVDCCPRALDAMVVCYQYLSIEFLNRIAQHKTASRIVYILKTCPTPADVLRSSGGRKLPPASVTPIVCAAEAAFAAFAESVAALNADNEYVSVLLISGDGQNETMKKDSALAAWLRDYLDASDALRGKGGARNSAAWIKAGAKVPGTFALFR